MLRRLQYSRDQRQNPPETPGREETQIEGRKARQDVRMRPLRRDCEQRNST